MARLRNIHPGEILLEEFLKPMGISAYRLAKEINIPQTRLSEILHGNRRITADTALRLSRYFGVSAKFWLGLQDDFDLEESQTQNASQLKVIKQYQQNEDGIKENSDYLMVAESAAPYFRKKKKSAKGKK